MSEKYIPEYIDPYRHAEQDLRFSGRVKLVDMHRLNACFNAANDVVDVDLHFGVDEQGLNYLKGRMQTKLVLQCQRCMEPYTYEIMSDFALGIVKSLDEANALPDIYEPAITKEGHLALRELIEDELILNLPLIPRHEQGVCQLALPVEDVSHEQDKKISPFRVLESLKEKKK